MFYPISAYNRVLLIYREKGMSEAAGFGMVGGPFFLVATPPSSLLLLLLELLLLLLPLLPLDLVFLAWT